jgi:hypothetical protein
MSLKLRNKTTGDEILIAGKYDFDEVVNGAFSEASGVVPVSQRIKRYGNFIDISIVVTLGKTFEVNDLVGVVSGFDIPDTNPFLTVKNLDVNTLEVDNSIIFKLESDGSIKTVKPITSDSIGRMYVMEASYITD